MQTGLVDSHVHLTDFEAGTDIVGLIADAAAVGVSHLVCNGTSEADWPHVLALAEANPEVVPCFGLHPWFVRQTTDDWLQALERFIEANECGIGEVGLDRLNCEAGFAEQELAFRSQLELARRRERPVTIHCVRAWGRLLEVMRDEPPLPRGFLVHAYGGPAEMLEPLAELGGYFSFSGNVLNEAHRRAREALASVPRDRLLLETDAPNMIPPEPFRAHRVTVADGTAVNSPANLPAIAGGIAELLGEEPDALRETVWRNSQRFFGTLLTRTRERPEER